MRLEWATVFICHFHLFVFFLCSTKALEVTNNKGFEPAMEWLLAHVDELDAAQPAAAVQADTPAESAAQADAPAASDNPTSPQGADGEAAGSEAKSLKCDEWYIAISIHMIYLPIII